MIYKVPKDASWLRELPDDLFSSENYLKIYTFFVVNSIVDGTSARGKSLARDYGWTNPWKSPYYLNKHLKEKTTDKNLLYSAQVYTQDAGSAKQKETMNDALEKANLKIFPQYEQEKICIYNSKKNQIISTFAHIRNSFAHCRFNVIDSDKGRVYCFEDVDPKKDNQGKVKVSARIVLFENTLIDWIELICGGEKRYNDSEESSQ